MIDDKEIAKLMFRLYTPGDNCCRLQIDVVQSIVLEPTTT